MARSARCARARLQNGFDSMSSAGEANAGPRVEFVRERAARLQTCLSLVGREGFGCHVLRIPALPELKASTRQESVRVARQAVNHFLPSGRKISAGQRPR
jgi:hypothetical protein